MGSLSFDQLYHIVRYLTYEDVASLCRTEKAYEWLCYDERFWIEKARDVYGVDLTKIDFAEDTAFDTNFSHRYKLLEYGMGKDVNWDSRIGVHLQLEPYFLAERLRYRYGVHDAETVLADMMRVRLYEDPLIAYETILDDYMDPSKTIDNVYSYYDPRIRDFDRKYVLRYGLKDWYKSSRVPIPFDLECDIRAVTGNVMFGDLFEALVSRMVEQRRYRDILVLIDQFMPFDIDTVNVVMEMISELDPEYDHDLVQFIRTLLAWRSDPNRGLTHDTFGVLEAVLSGLPIEEVRRVLDMGWLSPSDVRKLYRSYRNSGYDEGLELLLPYVR